jgi:pyruvate/2-oxoglutarate dehydrogenase complex dihydrolipoamide dehydrogenase (E3) component
LSETYDIVIIGGGSGGLIAADFAAQLDAKVALVEKHRIGGDCTWTGCVPSKTLLKVANVAHEMRTADRYGLTPLEPEIDLKEVMAHVRAVIDDVYKHETPEVLRANDIAVFIESPRFLDSHTLSIGDSTIKSKTFVIATGAHPFIPSIEGLEEVNHLTYESIWDLETLPKHLLVVGAGPVGCEMSQAFRRLGSNVTMVVSRDRVLPRDESLASNTLAQVFESEGINMHYNVRAESVWQEGDEIHLMAGDNELVGDSLLIATGRRPNVEGLELEKADVAYSAKGIKVNRNLRTSQRNIYAAGDCIGGYQFTHYAAWQGFMAVRNALLPGGSKAVVDFVPWTTFTDPEVAHVGLTEDQARKIYGDSVMTRVWSMDKVDRAKTDSRVFGFIKLVYKKNGALLGATIVSKNAGEAIQEWILALDYGLTINDVANSIHVYPTYSTANMRLAAEVSASRLLSGLYGRIIRGTMRLMLSLQKT